MNHSPFLFFTRKSSESRPVPEVGECIGHPVSQSHALSLVLKLCQGVWAQEFLAWGCTWAANSGTLSLLVNLLLEPLLPFCSANEQTIQSLKKCFNNVAPHSWAQVQDFNSFLLRILGSLKD